MQWQRWRRPFGGCLLVVFVFASVIGLIVSRFGAPYESPGSVSPDGKWRAWLERPNGSMEPMFYTLRVRPNSIFETPVCDVALVSNWFAERYSRIAWPGKDMMRFDYGIAERDTGGDGAPRILPIPKDCAGLVVRARHDRSLDATASRENEINNNYAVPVPDTSPL